MPHTLHARYDAAPPREPQTGVSKPQIEALLRRTLIAARSRRCNDLARDATTYRGLL
jgi:hypothetical protein